MGIYSNTNQARCAHQEEQRARLLDQMIPVKTVVIGRASKDPCSSMVHCPSCRHWQAIQHAAIDSGKLTASFFNNRQLRYGRISRALCLFLSNPGRAFSREELLAFVWDDKTVVTGNVAVLIYDLRMLLVGQLVTLKNVRGQGYALEILTKTGKKRV
ncbi:helix-turn-helix domain-containing protein [Aeromonas enteropelogenes]|uniref:helix-turn-helix domain-containing protein n=1 Tax=Aeromonas enteropelogenes TaxID=29489 RepID=UPI003134F1B6